MSRSSALGSHAPGIIDTPPLVPSRAETIKPPRPHRPSPTLPAKARRASLPDAIMIGDDGDPMNLARTGVAWPDGGDDGGSGANIGCAITSGSNPKRRSRSAGAGRDYSSKEHRMSPIQWRQWRRRSDEIRYWRESAGEVSSACEAISSMGIDMPSLAPKPSRGEETARDRLSQSDDDHATAADQEEDFNFGLPAHAVPSPEPISVEERLVTLEIKVMDFEYALSKLQATLQSPRDPGPPDCEGMNPPMFDDAGRSRRPPMPPYHPGRPSQDSSPPASSHGVPMTPASQKSQAPPRTPPSRSTGRLHPRPTSVATTLKGGSAARVSRPQTPHLTIEHYTTLITLIRREQSARQRLEDEVSHLQQQLRLLHPPPVATFRDFSGRHAQSPDVASASDGRRYRGRPRSDDAETTETTDTDEASFYEAYVTPIERREFERGHLRAEEEGVAF